LFCSSAPSIFFQVSSGLSLPSGCTRNRRQSFQVEENCEKKKSKFRGGKRMNFFLLVIFAVVATVDVSIDDGDVYCECSECVMIIDLVR